MSWDKGSVEDLVPGSNLYDAGLTYLVSYPYISSTRTFLIPIPGKEIKGSLVLTDYVSFMDYHNYNSPLHSYYHTRFHVVILVFLV